MANQNRLTKFWHELKRRKVIQVIIIYAPIAFIVIQLIDILEDDLNLPEFTMLLVIILLVVGFIIAAIFSWIFDVSSKGISVTEPEVPKDGIESNKQVPEKSIIVLPFENISSDPEQEYFSDGLTEEIITDLSYIKDLLVISRSSAMTFKGSKQTLKKIASKVNVKYVLEGSVRKSGNDLRIVAQLIDAQSDTHVWAEKYTGKLDDIFDIQEKVSRSVSESLKGKLQSGELEKIMDNKVDNIHVYECYLKSRPDLYKYTEEALKSAERNLRYGLDLYGPHVLLYTGLGQVYFQLYDSGIDMDPDNLNKTEEYLRKIFEMQPDSAEGFLLSGLMKLKRENAITAFNDFKKAMEINPTRPETLMWYCFIQLFHFGQPEKAKSVFEKLLEIDPLTSINLILPAFYHWLKGEHEKALNYIEKSIKIEPNNILSIWYKGQLLILTQNNQAADYASEQWKNDPGFFQGLLMVMYHAYNGRKNEALEYLTESMLKMAWEDFALAWFIAGYYAVMNEKELAIKYIERLHEKGMINYPLIAKHDPLLENIRNEPSFKKLLKTVKKEWEEFEV
ncbi:tetratricopeptide repeat protein [Maribellus mangrovi]|uniref:tetratricopeptide repeat protein n=1 Tax=Maribellus mangrovi TaxID=3133146 RepID=UPI0030ECE121